MQNTYIVTGTVTDPHTVKLDEALPANLTKVRLVVEPVSPPVPRPLEEVMAEIRERQHARGERPTPREEVDQYLNEERASWDW